MHPAAHCSVYQGTQARCCSRRGSKGESNHHTAHGVTQLQGTCNSGLKFINSLMKETFNGDTQRQFDRLNVPADRRIRPLLIMSDPRTRQIDMHVRPGFHLWMDMTPCPLVGHL